MRYHQKTLVLSSSTPLPQLLGVGFRTSTPVQTKQTLTGSTPVYDAGSTTRVPSSTGEMGLKRKDSGNTALPSGKERFWMFEERCFFEVRKDIYMCILAEEEIIAGDVP